ncbi:MAG TPA: VWA domain-containing protein [Candidatus Sulfotelmatobacter sp.]|nr:VWA domain-containing protein [Candidatus Sulfotelmatobacter sp.]
MAVKEESTTAKMSEAAKLRVNVRLVLARVVVRDQIGHPIGNLQKEDFELYDNGKGQVISNFDVEGNSVKPETPVSSGTATPVPATVRTPPTFPARYIAYLFDDVRLNFGDLARVRDAAQHRIEELPPTDRIAIFTTSGQTVADFTDDRVTLRRTLAALMPRPSRLMEDNSCPYITMYMADLIENKNDSQALQVAVDDYMVCAQLPGQMRAAATATVESIARGVLSVGQEDSRVSLRVMQDAVRRMSGLPGQRTIVLVSPGFLTPELEYEYGDLIDRALREQVVINSLDARGLYVIIPGGDASVAGQHPDSGLRTMYETNSASQDSDILAVLADGTGGTFFQNNNDMDEGLRRLADVPEFYYVLGFTPQNLKSDGKFHSIKVRLANHQKYDVQARRGYYAPRHEMDTAEESKREIDDEIFSNEELHDLPVKLHTEFFKPTDDSAKLTVLARIDVKQLHYKQSNDRNNNDLTIVTAVFDRNGNFLQAQQKLVQMSWKNETLQAKLNSGITLKSSFDVKPGRYLVRVVARDSEQQLMSAENGSVDIP